MSAMDLESTEGCTLHLEERQRPSAGRLAAPLDGGTALTFRGYKVYPATRRLCLGDREIPIGGRAFDLLVVLLGARGTVVDQNDLMRQVWPSTIVDDSNLRFQMAVLRKALGADRDIIKTIPRRGYLIADEHDLRVAELIDAPDPYGAGLVDVGARASRTPGPVQPSRTDDMEPDEVEQRLAELEQENLRLKLAIADMTLGRLFPDPWRRSCPGRRGRSVLPASST